MGCLLIIFSLFVPRLVMFGIFLFTNWLPQAYSTLIWPLLGFIFMPYTTLAYLAAMLNNNHQLTGGWIVLVIAAVFIDLSGQSGSLIRYR